MLVLFVCFSVFLCVDRINFVTQSRGFDGFFPASRRRSLWVHSAAWQRRPHKAMADETGEDPADAETASGALTVSMALFMPRGY
jgi:hypothetical protein